MAGLDTDLATISAKLDLILAQFITLNKYLDACEPALGTCVRLSPGRWYLWHH
jgi:hypothetical protein